MYAGEYGEKNGRAHFHAVIFFKGKNFPKFEINLNTWEWDTWGYGYVQAQNVSPEQIRYTVKYMNKELAGQHAINKPIGNQSRRPPLGTGYYKEYAARSVRLGVVPQNRLFNVPKMKSTAKLGNSQVYQQKPITMPPHVFDKYMGYFIEAWSKRYGDKPIPEANEFYREWEEKQKLEEDNYSDRKLTALIGARHQTWTPNEIARLTTFRMAANDCYIVGKTRQGTYIARQFDKNGHAEAETQLYSRKTIRRALEGKHEFAKIDYYNAPIEIKRERE